MTLRLTIVIGAMPLLHACCIPFGGDPETNEPPATSAVTVAPNQVPPALSAGGSPSVYAIDIGGVQGQRWSLSGFDAEQHSRRGYAVRWDYGTYRYVAICDSTYGIHCLQALETLRPSG